MAVTVYDAASKEPGLSVAVGNIDQLLSWGLRNSLWVFPMATSCCGIELMAAAAARVDLDRMGTIMRASPRQADVMVVAGTITVKMAPRVRRLWDQMPEPKWCIAMGSCAISGDFYRDVYSVVPGIDTVVPVDVYIPGCPPNPEALMEGLMRLQDLVKHRRTAKQRGASEPRPERSILPAVGRVGDAARDPALTDAQTEAARSPGDLAGTVPEPRALPVFEAKADAPAPEASAGFAQLLKDHFGITELPKDAPPLVPVDRHVELAAALKAAGYSLFSYVVASHWPAPAPKNGEAERGPDEYELAYGLRRPEKGAELAAWRVRIPASEEIDSLAGVFGAADWQEREQYDLVGVRFRGHPDLRRILMPEAWDGHPLRRDFPIDRPCAPWR